MGRKKEFDKFDLYQKSVQSPDVDTRFFFNLYKRLRKRKPRTLREDFCGTFANLCAWVKLAPNLHGLGIDLDKKPISWGRKHNLPKLSSTQAARVHVIQGDVLKVKVPKVDIITALNFSYFCFWERELLLAYFRRCHATLGPRGIFLVDCFGGSECQGPSTDKTRKRGFWYYWEQKSFDPISYLAKFYIHFKQDGKRVRKRVFTYEWRMWTLPELQEIMTDAGFRETLVYWEGDDGEFRHAVRGEPDAAWIAYVVGIK
jgi:SAM-dependent methyltransferase